MSLLKAGYGEYFDEEDNKWLFYMFDFEKWFVADEVQMHAVLLNILILLYLVCTCL